MARCAVCVRALRQTPFFLAFVVFGMTMRVMAKMIGCGTGFVCAVNAHRRPTQLGRQQDQEENRKPTTHCADSINKDLLSSTTVVPMGRPTGALREPAGRNAWTARRFAPIEGLRSTVHFIHVRALFRGHVDQLLEDFCTSLAGS